MNRSIWVYDVETLYSVFTYTALNIDTQEIKQFVLHKDRWELKELISHLNECKGHIGFNNLNFDYPIIHYILKNLKIWESNNDLYSDIILEIYNEAQRIINLHNQPGVYTSIKESDVIIPQLDLFRIHHFNNKARTQSLKGLEIAMNYPNVQDMPISHDIKDITLEQAEEIFKYNLNDVLATYEFYKLSIPKIELRKDLNAKYQLNCINYPDSKIGEKLVLKLYCEASGLDPYTIGKMRTERLKIALKDIILPDLHFEIAKFDSFVKKLKTIEITNTKGEFNYSLIHKGFMYDFGTGGIHGCIKPGVYYADDDYIILDADVSSLYPSIAVVNKLFPEHLGEKFVEVYENILNQRIKAKKEGNNVISDALKLSLNSVYGKSNDKFSFLYDPKYTLSTTINGQLLILMLCDWLVDSIEDLTILQVNTDGITIKLHRNALKAYYQICDEWQKHTKLQLEFIEYSKMIIRDVNSYLAITTKGKVKYKGCFEINKELHKDNSFKIIPIALSEYFVNNIPIETTIKDHQNIYDFCGRQKFKSDSSGEIHYLKGIKHIVEKQQKNVRYYISNKGATFIKQYSKGSEEVINKNYLVTIFNKFEQKEMKEYNINYQFYINETNKIIDSVMDKQLELF